MFLLLHAIEASITHVVIILYSRRTLSPDYHKERKQSLLEIHAQIIPVQAWRNEFGRKLKLREREREITKPLSPHSDQNTNIYTT